MHHSQYAPTSPTPAPVPGKGARALNDYMEKEIGGVRYRVSSVFSEEGDFGELYEKALVDRAMKLYRQGCAQGAAGS